ncbi:Hsp33 family molecular chaperone HslO [Methylobacillus arboreus]|uniref:Hsp33 family molecular chaperone HslO n=1 Tax=Methylobacillus arboreus TaxID=755170 RepID=UPI001E3C999B|nr:Hsp33 family molecular chaperone HslO [Methylobacillus arboreus]MCB5191793.1 Hsp33 family molecular chaperone HslO [Methylobacillus arboreus]
MQISDQLHRFIFESTPVRGNIVHLDESFTQALQHHGFPPILRKALGELMAASALLAATLKLQGGTLVLQVQGKGPLKLLVVECTADLKLRATAKWSGDFNDISFGDMVSEGHFVITLDPRDGGQPYQGIVLVEGDSIAEILQNYMQRSEQIDTHMWLACDGKSAAGMLLQKLPDQPDAADPDAWNRITTLADTVQDEELLTLAAVSLIKRLFNEEDVRLYKEQLLQFHCSCSRESVGNMLRMLGEEEVADILAEQHTIDINCDFCNAEYHFDQIDAEQLFASEIVLPGNDVRH